MIARYKLVDEKLSPTENIYMVFAKIFHQVCARSSDPSGEYITLENIRDMIVNHGEQDLNISQQIKLFFFNSINNITGSDSIQNVKREILR